jgi:hypothetical protein
MASLVFAHARYDGPWRSAKDAESSMIYKWTYIQRTKEFLVRFWDSTMLYVYTGVSPATINAFVDAPSRGAFFNERIKGKYRHKRIDYFFRRLPRREAA